MEQTEDCGLILHLTLVLFGCNINKTMNDAIKIKLNDLLTENKIDYESLTINGVEYEYYFKNVNICLFIIDEEKYNEKTINKLYFKELVKQFSNNNVQLMLLYSTYFDNKFDIVTSRLLYRLKNTAVKIDARKCVIKEVTYSIAKDFLNKYHFQGNVMSKIRVGLFYHDELVSLIVMNKPRYNKEYEYEIGRYVVKFNYNVRGNFSKMINYFITTYKPKSILTYHDALFGDNKVYKQSGFTELLESPPGFFWYKDGKTFNRRGFWKNTLKDKLPTFDPEMSAHNNMRINGGYTKVWDIGQKKFLWTMK